MKTMYPGCLPAINHNLSRSKSWEILENSFTLSSNMKAMTVRDMKLGQIIPNNLTFNEY